MSLLSAIISRGVAASRPAAGSVPIGSLYYSTDTGVIERNNGSSWDAYGGGFANPMTTQDDLIVGGSSGAAARLAKGTDGQVLTVDPTTHHLIWATPSGGGSALTVEEVDGSPTDAAVTKIVFPNGTLGIASHVATYTPASGGGLVALSDTTLGSDTATLTYSPPGSGYRDLLIRVDGRTDEATGHSATKVQLSADTGSNYGNVFGDTQWSGSGLTATYNVLGETGVAYVRGGYVPGTSGPTNSRGSIEILIPNYLDTTFHKTMLIRGHSRGGTGTTDLLHFWREGWWQSTAAVTQVDINPVTAAKKFKTGTRFTVWGVKAS